MSEGELGVVDSSAGGAPVATTPARSGARVDAGVRNTGMVVWAEIDPDLEDKLRKILTAIRGAPRDNPYVRWHESESTHFARWAIIEDDAGRPSFLLLKTNFAGTVEGYIDELTRVAEPGFRAIYGCCKGFGADTSVPRYLADHVIPSQCYFAAYPYRTRNEILQALDIRERAWKFVDENRSRLEKLSARDIHEAVREHLLGQGVWLPDPMKVPYVSWPTVRNTAIIALVVTVVGFAGLVKVGLWWVVAAVVGPVLLLLISLRVHELVDDHRDPRDPMKPARWGRQILDQEGYANMTTMTMVNRLKPGLTRKICLRGVCLLITFLARITFNQGMIAGIVTIHFAHWIIVGDRMIFLSLFDGNFDNYVGDFVDQLANFLSAIWSNTHNFPKTKLLFWEGAAYIDDFHSWLRQHEQPFDVWYTAYPHYSQRNLLNALAFAEGVKPILDESEAAAWLRRL